MHQQQQAILRNSSGSAGVLVSLFRVACAWKSKRVGIVRQSLTLMALAVLHLLLLAACGIFSSRVALVGDEVLISATRCGRIGQRNADDVDGGLARELAGRQVAAQGQRYARTCYNLSSPTQPAACKTYVASQLPMTASNVPCPFSDEICALPEAMQIDTGYLDSNQHFGFNTGPGSRLRFRKRLTCVPLLAEERFSSNWTSTSLNRSWTFDTDTFKYYYLGNSTALGDVGDNVTWFVNNASFWGFTTPRSYSL